MAPGASDAHAPSSVLIFCFNHCYHLFLLSIANHGEESKGIGNKEGDGGEVDHIMVTIAYFCGNLAYLAT